MGPDDDSFRDFLRRCGVGADRLEQLGTLRRLEADLRQANRRRNLTGPGAEGDFWCRHVADSVAAGLIAPELLTRTLRVADVGCGAGFPLLVLAWANPRLVLVGIEPRGKRAAFARDEAAELGLGNVTVEAVQAREAARKPEFAGAFDAVLLRAVGEVGRLVRECRGLLRPDPGAKLVFYKTPEGVASELPLSRREAAKFGLTVRTSEPFDLPGGAGRRQSIILERC